MNKEFIKEAGCFRIIIWLILLLLFMVAPFIGVSITGTMSMILDMFVMNVIMTLAMVPMIRSGCGLNFGLPLGVMAGLLGAVISLVFCPSGLGWGASLVIFAITLFIAVLIAAALGYCYGKFLNYVMGYDMIISIFVGYFCTLLMSTAWMTLPFKNHALIFDVGGGGLRSAIKLDEFWGRVLDNFLTIKMGNFFIPTGTLLFIGAVFFLAQRLMRTITDARATGKVLYVNAPSVDSDRARMLSVVLSTVLGAVGILVYAQSFGFINPYETFSYVFPAAGAIILGGASNNKASIWNVIVGTFLFQSILSMTPMVVSHMLQTDISEVMHTIIIGGIALFAITRMVQVKR